ncbi:MAG: ABC transporter permease [Ferruginibacter sp.]
MIWIHFISAVRSLFKNRLISLINILGLTVGLTAFLFIINYVLYEESYDTFFKGSDRVYRVSMAINDHGQQIFNSAQTPRQLYFIGNHDIPEIESNTITYFEPCLVKFNNQSFIAQNVLWVDEGFDKVFPLKMEQGKTNFERPLTAIISSEKAKSIFGNENAVGKVIKVNEGMPIEITGVFAALPSNTHLQAEYFFSVKTFVHYGWIPAGGDWQGNDWWNYLRLKPGASMQAVQQKLNTIADREMKFLKDKGQTAAFNLQPLKEVHFLSGLTGEFGAATNKSSLYTLFIIGVFTLFIAWVNFVNLSTAQSKKKQYDLGVKKILGATKWHLWMQSLFESLIINAVALALSLAAYFMLAGSFAQFFTLPPSSGYIPQYKVAILLLIAFVIGIIFSSVTGTFNILRSGSWNLKARTTRKAGFKKGLVIAQLVISMVFISGTILVFKQINFMQQHELGMNINRVVTINAPVSLNISPLKRVKYESFRSDLLNNTKFLAGTATMNIPGQEPRWHDEEYLTDVSSTAGVHFCVNNADDGFIKTYALQLLAGRNFYSIPDHNKDKGIINERAAKVFGFKTADEAIGKYFYKKGEDRRMEIIGVVKDFHNEGLQKPIYPMVWNNDHPYEFGYYSFLIKDGNLQNSLQLLERKWKEHYSADPFHCVFVDDFFNHQYASEVRFGKFYILLAVLSISISCLGLYGLLLFYLGQKRKEIAIRKISGAYISQLVFFINKSFIRWNLVAFFIACPLVYLIMHNWLQNFAYQTDISWWVFIVSGAATFIITLLTVSWQSYKAALQKPTVALKQE